MSPIFLAHSQFEQNYWALGKKLICGVDEVGRGCFAGPVVVGSVIFEPDCIFPEGIADSKLLKPEVRFDLAGKIKKCAKDFAIAVVDVPIINQIGIGKATQQAFAQVIKQLKQLPDFILIDAFFIQEIDKKIQLPIKKGDMLSVSIAAASIIAKVYRDNLMQELDSQFPGYGFGKHKGYGTKEHQAAIKQLGLCKLHRTSFNLQKFI